MFDNIHIKKSFMKNLLFIFAISFLFSCSKSNEPTPVKEGTFSINYKVDMPSSKAPTTIDLSFGHFENNKNSQVYNGHRVITVPGAANVDFTFDTLVKADFVKVSILAPNLINNTNVKIKYNSSVIFNQTVGYSSISPGYTKELNF